MILGDGESYLASVLSLHSDSLVLSSTWLPQNARVNNKSHKMQVPEHFHTFPMV